MYNKKVLNKATANLDKAKAPAKKKDIIVDPMGQWAHPGQPTRIPSNNITMKGVAYPVLAKPNIGQPQMMYPGMDYQFPGAAYVDEFPQGTDEDYIEAELTPEEIEEYRKGGYIIEDISVPKLTKAQLGKTVGRYFVNPYEYNYDTRALRTKEDLDPAFGIGVTRENLFSGPRVKENEVSTTGTISSRLPYNNPKPSIRGQLDISYEPKPKGVLIPSTNTMMGVGYDPTVGFNSDLTVNQRFGFANVDASRFKKDDWKKGSATWGIGPAIETSFQTKAPDTLHGQEVDPNFTATSTKGAQYAVGLYGDVAFQPFKYPMHVGANAKLMADPFSAKSANAARDTTDENLNWTINPGLKVYASFPIRTNKIKPNQPEVTKTAPVKNKYTPKYLQTGGASDNYFTVAGSDGVYRKVNGKWQVDWNRSGNFQPLSKGNVAKRTAVLNAQAKPLYDRDYNSLVESRSYVAAPKKATAQPQTATQKKAQQNFNQNFKVTGKDNYTKVKDKIESDKENLIKWSQENNIPVDKRQLDDIENWGWNVYGKVGTQRKPDEMHTFTPEAPQEFWDKTADVVSNPMTSLGYFMRGQDIPDYMQRDMDRGTFGYYANGDLHTERNPLDFALSDMTGLSMINDARNTFNGLKNKDVKEAGLGALGIIPFVSELRKAKKVINAADDINNINKGIGLLGDTGNNILKDYKNIEELRLANHYKDFKSANKSFPDLFPTKEIFDQTKSQSSELLKKYKKDFVDKFGPGKDEEILLYGAHNDLGKSTTNQNFLANDEFANSVGLTNNLTNQEKFLGDAYQLEFSPYFNRKAGPNANQNFSNYLADNFDNVITKNKVNQPVQVSRVSNFDRPVKTIRTGSTEPQFIHYDDLEEGDVIYPEHNWSTTSDITNDVWGSNNPTAKTARINLPQGQSTFRPNMFKGSQYTNEQELVLPSRLGYKVSGINKNGFGNNDPRFILDIHNPYKMGGYLPEAQFGIALPQMFRNSRKYNRFMRNLPFGMGQYLPGVSNINVRKSGMFGRPKQYSIDFNNAPLQQMMASVSGIPSYINKSQRTPAQNKQVTNNQASKINNEALQEVATATQSTVPLANSTVQTSETKPVIKTEPVVKQAPVAVESKPVVENKQVVESRPAEVIKKIETPVVKETVSEVVKEPEYGSQEEEFCYPGGTCFTLSPDQYDDQNLFNDLPRMLSIYSDRNNKGWTVDNENGFPQELDLSKVTKEDVLNTINSTSKNVLPIADPSEYANLDEFADKFLKYHQDNQRIYNTKRYLDLFDDPYSQAEDAEPYQKYADWLNVMGTQGEDGPNDIWTTKGVLKKLPKQQKGGKLGPIHLDEGRKTLRDWVYGADIGMLQEQLGGYTDAELTDEEIQAYRDAGYHIEELD